MNKEILLLFFSFALVCGLPFDLEGSVSLTLGSFGDLDEIEIPLELVADDEAPAKEDIAPAKEDVAPATPKENEDDNKIEPDAEPTEQKPLQWDCADSTLGVLKCVLNGGGTNPQTKGVFKAMTGTAAIPANPPAGFPVYSETVIKIEGSLEDWIQKFQALLTATIDVIKDAVKDQIKKP